MSSGSIGDINFDYIQKGSTSNNFDQVTVKFYTADAKVFTQSFPNFYNVGFVKRNLGDLFNCPRDIISLLYREEHIPNETSLNQFKPDKYGILEFKLQSKDRSFKIPLENAYKGLVVPDILTVRVEKDNEVKDIVVEIENKSIEKPYLGGLRDIQSGVLYHHGYTQTGPPPPKVPPEMKNHRDTQTYFTRNRKTENANSTATQVPTNGLYLPTICDKILTAGPYETADEREKRLDVEGKVRIIQRFYRSWIMKRRLKEISAEYQKRMRLELEREEKERLDNESRRKKDLVSKVFPIKPGDFAMLCNMVERWKKSEIDRITALSCGAAKISEFYLLLEKEIEILQSIERLRMKVKKDLELKKVIDFFKAIGSPIEWDSEYKHIHISMDTVEAQKGRIYFELYRRLCDRNQSKEERIETYLDIKDHLITHHCSESQEIMTLIDRVCEFLARGMSSNYLTGLQKRIEALVLHHFKVPECNEGVTRHMKKKVERMNRNLIFCQSCQKLKPIESFTIHARLEKMKTCTTCKWLDKAEEPWIDLAPHKFILRQIRNYERLHHGTSSIAFILQDRDIHFIINNIWHSHSSLSECTDVYQLRLVRWKKDEEWSPWNCILLTLDEAKAHLRVQDLQEVYEKEFIDHIFNKHVLAKIHFKHLTNYDRHFTEFARGNPKLDENSDYYIKPNKHECDIVFDSDDDEKQLDKVENIRDSDENKVQQNVDEHDEIMYKRIYIDKDSDDDYDE